MFSAMFEILSRSHFLQEEGASMPKLKNPSREEGERRGELERREGN